MYLLVGGTGLVGGKVAERLRRADLPVRALVRSQTPSGRLEALNVQVVRGDLRDPASLVPALDGVATVVTTANAMARNLAGDGSVSIHDTDEVGNANLIDAAARAGVERFIFVSMDRHELEVDTPFTRAKRATEARLAATPMRSVVVRPEAFQEVWLSPVAGVDLAHGTVRIFGQGRTRTAYVAVDDVAAAIVRLATMPDPPEEAVLAGPDAMSLTEIVDLWADLTHRPVKVSHVPRPMLAIGSALLRPVKPALSSTMAMARHADRVEWPATDETLRTLGVEPRGVRSYVTALAAG